MTFASAPPELLGSRVREACGVRRYKRLSVQLPEGALVFLSKVGRRRSSALRVGGSESLKQVIKQMCVCAISTSLTGQLEANACIGVTSPCRSLRDCRAGCGTWPTSPLGKCLGSSLVGSGCILFP